MEILFAILAAVCNATIGVFSKVAFNSGTGVDHTTIAFYRCLFAFICLTLIILFKKGGLKQVLLLKKYAGIICITSFFGVFVLYYFEIWALSVTSIPVVSFLLYASGIVAIIIGIVWLKESLNVYKAISLILVLVGIYLIFSTLLGNSLNWQGGLLAVIAGSGYSVFLVLTKRFKIPSTLTALWWLFGFGSLFLFVPFAIGGLKMPSLQTYPYILSLALVPTIGGYYFTTKALSLMEASKVQIFEMSEPMFASLFALILFGERLTVKGCFGGVLIILSLYILQFNTKLKEWFQMVPSNKNTL